MSFPARLQKPDPLAMVMGSQRSTCEPGAPHMAVKAEKKPAPRSRRSKADVQEEFEALAEQAANREPLDTKSKATLAEREAHTRAEVDGVTVESVVQRIAALGLDVSRALGTVAEQLSSEVRLLASVREAVAIERRELERLHQIDIAATATDLLIEDYATKRAELEAEIEAQRREWREEAARVERERKEQDEALKKQRQREAEDFEYKKALERKKAQDKYDEDQRQLERRNAERQAALEKDWALREAALKDQEDEIAELRAEVDQFPARLGSAVEGASAEARSEVEAQFERQMLILKKDAEAEARVNALTVKSLEATIAVTQAQIAALEKQVAESKKQVQDIAVRAIEGASGARALSHINEIAMEQAKNRPQG
jgi:hypothetical protein